MAPSFKWKDIALLKLESGFDSLWGHKIMFRDMKHNIANRDI